MHIATDPRSLPLAPRALARGCAVTIGNFDGVHLGHQRLIGRAVACAHENGLPAVVITFEPHPLRVLFGDKAPPQLMGLQHKLECFAELGVNLVLVMPFTPETAAISPEDFVREVLVQSLNTRKLVVGYDYGFGKGRRGNAVLLAELGRQYGFDVEEFPAVIVNGAAVSSTRIREALFSGDAAAAAALLGRPHSVEGVVEHGMNRGGRLLGFPTANLCMNEDLLLPRTGVYAVMAEVNPKRHTLPGVCLGGGRVYHKAVANVGRNPTFGEEKLRVETHLLDFFGNIYGQPF
ncbi:bifunctional riboflavin kinase/FAD synthetase, partial [Desulfovibrio sp. OttesenSCG-928-A18]|nr:bifunctional riboflavin kinase/FAD synthetase [Desulfovibrio sp. OttesenSCG-928-A18]